MNRAEAGVTATIKSRAKGTTSCLRDRPQAGYAMCHSNAYGTTQLAFHADAVRRQTRLTARHQCANDLNQLMPIDGAPAEFIFDFDMVSDGSRRGEAGDVVRPGVDGAKEVLVIAPVPQCLNSS